MDSCLFCKIIVGSLSSTKVFEDSDVLAIRDIHPKAKVHVLVIPKRHIASIAAVAPTDRDLLGGLLLAAKRVAEQEGIGQSGYKVVINCGEHGGQFVDHLHVHVLGGEPLRGVL